MRKRFLPHMVLAIAAFAGLLPAPPALALSDAAAESPALPDAPDAQAGEERKTITERSLFPNIAKDQLKIWTSPLRLRPHDAFWLVPVAAATGAALATDTHTMRDVVSHDANFNKKNVDASNYLLGGTIAVPVALYGLGVLQDRSRARETGLLAGEALADGVIAQEVLKVILQRERPLYDNARGDFWSSNTITNGSLPSSHSVLAWATASVVAQEYPGRWTTLGAYGLATGVSLTRVLGQEHFPTDVFVGSVAGWLIGHYVYRSHHANWVGFTRKRAEPLDSPDPTTHAALPASQLHSDVHASTDQETAETVAVH